VLILANAALRILDGKTQFLLQHMISREQGTIALAWGWDSMEQGHKYGLLW